LFHKGGQAAKAIERRREFADVMLMPPSPMPPLTAIAPIRGSRKVAGEPRLNADLKSAPLSAAYPQHAKCKSMRLDSDLLRTNPQAKKSRR
jgi:hypothetical protein